MFRLLLPTLLSLLFLPAEATTKTPDPKPASEAHVIDSWCADLGGRLRSVDANHCKRQTFVADTQRTPGGRALIWRDIAATGKQSDKAPRALVIGGIHGDELTAVSIVFRWLEWIGDTSATNYQWRVIPVANPDGLMIRPSTRVNANGVDLNRNFPTPDWDSDAQKYWIERTGRDPRRFPGKTGGSEIETRWLEKQIAEFKPDVIISVHAPYNLLDYDGPAPQPLRFGRLALNRLGVYPGSMGNYGGLYKSVPVVTIELPNATMMPSPNDQRTMWVDMLKWMNSNIKADSKALAPTEKRPEKYGDPRIDHKKID